MENHVKKNGFNVPYLNVGGRTSVRASAPGGRVQLADAKEKEVIIWRRIRNWETRARSISTEAQHQRTAAENGRRPSGTIAYQSEEL